MTKAEMEKVRDFVENENKTLTQAKAIKNLQDAGIIDKKGNITKPYRGVFVKTK